MKTITGDLLHLALAGRFDAIIHGCNCFCTMGRGIALPIKQQFPEAYQADLKTIKGDRTKLGTISYAKISRPPVHFSVINAYTQFDYRSPGVRADYPAIRSAFKHIKTHFPGQRLAYPKIAAGLARGDWPLIASIIDEELSNEDHTLVELPPKK